MSWRSGRSRNGRGRQPPREPAGINYAIVSGKLTAAPRSGQGARGGSVTLLGLLIPVLDPERPHEVSTWTGWDVEVPAAAVAARHRVQELDQGQVVAVGVDNSSSRWFVQQQWPDRLYVGATNNREAVLTAHHPGEPCAGCAHPDPVEPGEMVPTISFVSFWAGLLQACALLAEADTAQGARRVVVYPFGLGEKLWSMASALPKGARCAIGCPASGTIEIVRQGTPSASAPPHRDGAAGRGGGPDDRRGLWRE